MGLSPDAATDSSGNEPWLVDRWSAVFAKQFDKFCQAALFVGSEVIVNVPAEVILAEIVGVLGPGADDGIQRIESEVAGLAERPPERCVLHAPAQCPHRIHKRKIRQLRPGRAEVPDLMLVGSEREIRPLLREAKEFGMDTLDHIIRQRTEYDYEFRKDYLGWHIHYHFGSDEKRGLAKFMELLRRHGCGPIYEPRFVE